MQNIIYVPVSESTYRDISNLLEKLGSKRSVNHTLQQFIDYGLENAEWKADVFFPDTAKSNQIRSEDGYKWKHPDYRTPIFLPNGTNLRMEYNRGEFQYALVSKGQLVHKGQSFSSPSKLVSFIAKGTSRSAPRDLYIKRPADAEWIQAKELFITVNS